MTTTSFFAPVTALVLMSATALVAGCSFESATEATDTAESMHSSHRRDAGAKPIAPVEDPDEGVAPTVPASLPSCSATATVSAPIATGTPFGSYASYDPGPIAPIGDHSFVFLDSSMWMNVSHGSGITQARPLTIKNAKYPRAFTSLSGRSVVIFDDGGGATTQAATFDGTSFGAPIATPCSYADVLNGACDAHAAGDGHVWIRKGSNLYEQVGTTLQLRGGAPALGVWDVDAPGNVLTLGGSTDPSAVLAAWKLAPGSGGWVKTGSLPKAMVDAAASDIEGGFQLGSTYGARAADGSIHVFSDARCINEGQRNKGQLHLRSRDGSTWEIQHLPPAAALYGANVTWRNVAIYAQDYERVRTVVMSSPQPTSDGFSYSYPNREYDLVVRCRTADGHASFARAASARVPGWTERAFATFSNTGVATFLTRDGIVQIP
jgi:hypothetical protein